MGQHHIADTDGGRNGLGKRVQVDDPPRLVHGEQRGDGTPHKAELAVIIVLQNKAVIPLRRPAQQLLPPGDGHDDTGGIMVAGRDVYHVGAGLVQRRYGQPRAVQRHGHHLRLIAPVDAGDLAVARILHGVALVPSQKLHQHIVQLLRAGADDDLLLIHRHAPELSEIGGDGTAQLRRALRRHGTQQAGTLLQDGLAHQARPDGEGEILRRNGVGDQIHLPDVLGRWRGLLPVGRGGQRTLDGADVVALLLHAVDIPLRHQLLVGVLHRDDADLQMSGQRPLGGQLLPCRQPPGEDIVLDPAV